MSAFIIYDPATGLIKRAVKFNLHPMSSADLAAFIASNTPPGMQALSLASDSDPAITNQGGWKVASGKLVTA